MLKSFVSPFAQKPEVDGSASIESIEEGARSRGAKGQTPQRELDTDRFGFIHDGGPSDWHVNRQGPTLNPSEIEKRRVKEEERLAKWVKMLKRWDFTLKNREEKLKRRVRKGVPDAVRAKAWKNFMQEEVKKWRRSHPIKTLKENVARGAVSDKTMEDIEKDVDRTFPNHILFQGSSSAGQRSLRTILQWYAALDPEIGYCQGMSFVAATLLTYTDEEDAFYILVAILQRPQAPKMRSLYQMDMFGTRQVQAVFEELAKIHIPIIWDHLMENNIHPIMYLTEWVMPIFSRNFNFEFVTRVWDIFIFEDMKIIYRVSLALLKSIESELLSSSFERNMELIRSLPQKADIEVIIEIAWSIPLRRDRIQALSDEFVASQQSQQVSTKKKYDDTGKKQKEGPGRK